MQASQQAKEPNRHSLSWFRALFETLSSPALASVAGVHQAEFVGPFWLRAIAGPGLYPLGLGGWWGKRFDDQGQGFNIVRRKGDLVLTMPVQLREQRSQIDGELSLVVVYPPTSRFPWPSVIDELRQIGDSRMLGMTLVNRDSLSKLALPFLLHHRSDIHEFQLGE